MNRILPGTSVETAAGARSAQLGINGVVAMPLALSWGAAVTVIRSGDDTTLSLGYRSSDPAVKLVAEVMNYADKLILYRLNGGEKASGELNTGLTAEAAYGGARGNAVSVSVEAADALWRIRTYLGTVEMDSQTVRGVSDFQPNGLIALTGAGSFAEKTVRLTGGTDAAVDADAYDAFLAEMPLHTCNFISYTGTDETVVRKLIGYINERRASKICDNIQLVQSVVAADDPTVIHSTVGGKTVGYDLTPAEACATMAGILAACGIRNSATHYQSVKGWTDIAPRLKAEQQEARTLAGETLFVLLNNAPAVLYDINSLTTYSAECPEDMHKGLVMRTLDRYSADLKLLLDTRVIGHSGTKNNIRNDTSGRNQVKGMVAEMTAREYLDRGYIAAKSEDDPDGFTSDDVFVTLGNSRDEINVQVGIKPNDAIDKIYATVTAR